MAKPLSVDEAKLLEVYSNPASFAQVVLGAETRWYQESMLEDESQYKVFRCGRRVGKTAVFVFDILYNCFTKRNCRCIVVAPYESSLDAVFDEIRKWIGDSELLSASVKQSSRSPQRIQFGNGSWIRGYTAGTKSGGNANVIRGHGADRLYLDEADYLSDSDIDSIMGLTLERRDIHVWAASTPTGKRARFYEWCNTPEMWREFHFPSMVNPQWDESMEQRARSMFTEIGYVHEVLAEWGQQVDGVYSKELIDAAREEYKYVSRAPDYPAFRAIGCDWDKFGAASQIVVTEFHEGKFKVLTRVEVPRSEFTYDNAVRKIIELNAAFDPNFIYCDAGQGEYQIEALHKHGLEHPETGLDKKVKRIPFGSVVEVFDPFTGQMQKRPRKPHMVNMATVALERGMVMLCDRDVTIWRQLENYYVAKISKSGEPVYTSVEEHAHDAWVLSLHALMTEYPEIMKMLSNPTYARKVASVSAAKLLDRNIGVGGKEKAAVGYDRSEPGPRWFRHRTEAGVYELPHRGGPLRKPPGRASF